MFVPTKDSDRGAKKKYVLLKENGNLEIKNFESIKRNSSKIVKEVQENILKIILKEENLAKAKTYLNNILKELAEGKTNLEKLVIKTMLTKPIDEYESKGPHVIAAMQMKEDGYAVAPGQLISYVITKTKGSISAKAKPLYKAKDYDAEYYKEQIMSAVKKIFEVFDKKEGAQKSLDRFF